MEDAKSGGGEAEVVTVELQTAPGWTRKFTPRKGGTPKKNEITYIAPTGEELNNRKQVDQYLKSHPGGPAISEFDWNTCETPRRSARISEKAKSLVQLEPEPTKKRSRKSAGPKTDDTEAESAHEINKIDVQMQDAEATAVHNDLDAKKISSENDPDPNIAEIRENAKVTKTGEVTDATILKNGEGGGYLKLQKDSALTKINAAEAVPVVSESQSVKDAEISGDAEGPQMYNITSEEPSEVCKSMPVVVEETLDNKKPEVVVPTKTDHASIEATTKKPEAGEDFKMQEDSALTNTNAAVRQSTVSEVQSGKGAEISGDAGPQMYNITNKESQGMVEDTELTRSTTRVAEESLRKKKVPEPVVQQEKIEENGLQEVVTKSESEQKNEDGEQEMQLGHVQPKDAETSDKKEARGTETNKAYFQAEKQGGEKVEATENGGGKRADDDAEP